MDIGTGIAISGVSFSLIMLIYRVLPPRSTKGQTHADDRAQAIEVRDAVDHDRDFRCPDHSGVIKGIDNIEKTQNRHEGWLKDISKDVKQLLRNNGG
jgi:hypothetical protein